MDNLKNNITRGTVVFVKDLNKNKRLILTTGILCLTVGILYFISLLVGGDFKDFCEAACPWVLFGIGFAAWAAYSSQLEK